MKLSAVLLICMFIAGANFLQSPLTNNESSQATLAIKKKYLEDYDQFVLDAKKLKNYCNKDSSAFDIIEAREKLSKLRLSFKRIEFIFDYYEPEFNYLNINGGPLPKVQKELSEVGYVEPNGLQTLDEISYLGEPDEIRHELKTLSSDLYTAIQLISPGHLDVQFTDRKIIEALRSGIVRVITLGLSGFDTPGSVNGIEEAHASLNSMKEAFYYFKHNLDMDAEDSYHSLTSLYSQANRYLKDNTDFEDFDRLHFLKTFVNPIYSTLYFFQEENAINIDQFRSHAQNYKSLNLFDADFILLDYYSEFNYAELDDERRIKLGKTLFFDPILSRDMKMSCATCHQPELGFSDGLAKSETNTAGVFTKRNSPGLIDAAYSSRFFWDMREYSLERQVAHVVSDSMEFNIDFPTIINRLSSSDEYLDLFRNAYPDISKKHINRRSISNAIAAYVNTLKSYNSKFDKYVRGESEELSESEYKGFNLFMGKAACATCHFLPNFNGSVPPFYQEAESEILGVSIEFDTIAPVLDTDIGRAANGLPLDDFKHFQHSFKTVTIRNAALTAPYMHNGGIKDLSELMEFYNLGGGAGMGLELPNQTLAPDPLNLSSSEKQNIIDFMHSLTDTSGLTSKPTELPKFKYKPNWNNRSY